MPLNPSLSDLPLLGGDLRCRVGVVLFAAGMAVAVVDAARARPLLMMFGLAAMSSALFAWVISRARFVMKTKVEHPRLGSLALPFAVSCLTSLLCVVGGIVVS